MRWQPPARLRPLHGANAEDDREGRRLFYNRHHHAHAFSVIRFDADISHAGFTAAGSHEIAIDYQRCRWSPARLHATAATASGRRVGHHTSRGGA